MVEAFREAQQPEIPRSTEGGLPEQRIFDLLSSVGNGENKALELIVMKEGVIYSKNALYKEVINHQVEGKRWEMNKSVPFQHCEDSFSPIGLVAKEALSPDGTAWGYQITEYGLRVGVPFIGLLLKWSYEHPEYSLYKMFGSTNSKSIRDEQALDRKRAQDTRYKIFWEVSTNPINSIRQEDLANAINEYSTLVHVHIKSLNKDGVISYEGSEPGKSYSYFKRKETVPDKEPEPYGTNRILSTRLYKFLTQHCIQEPSEYLSVEEITNALIQEYPEYKNLNKNNLSSRVATTLTDFEKQGYTERERFRANYRSEIILSDQQREVIESFVTLLDSFRDGHRQTIEEGRRFAQKVANDPNLFSELMLKAKEASPYANRTKREDTEFYIISIIQDYPDITVNQIQEILQKNYDKRFTSSGLRHHLLVLIKQQKIVSKKTKSGNVYRAIEEENQTPSSQN